MTTASQTLARPPLIRRLLASAVDGFVLFVLPVLWWHWVQWAVYTDTFVHRWPPGVAMPVMTLVPLTALWLEAVSGSGLGKLLFGLRITSASGATASLGRQLLRAAIKWSPAWVGPAALMLDLARHTYYAETFASDHLVPLVTAVSEHLPAKAKPLAWSAEQAMRGMNFGVILAVVLAVGQIGILLPARKNLIDRLSGTAVRRRTRARK